MDRDMPVFSASDGGLRKKIDACIERRRPFAIQAGRDFRHRDALLRELRIVNGERDRRGFFRGMADAVVTGDVIGCWSAAVNSANYSWDCEFTPDVVTILLDPDPTALKPRRHPAP